MTSPARMTFATPADLRDAIRAGDFTGPTAGLVPGYVQTNLVVVRAAVADDFAEFCRLNPQPCPLVARTAPGDAQPRDVAPGADLRIDVPRYRVFRHGLADEHEPTEVRDAWQADFVGFLLGCSFTFEAALGRAGLTPRHVVERCNVPMFRTTIPCQPAGPFHGDLVVSMRPYLPEQVDAVRSITARYPGMHGGPVHVGDPAALGIGDVRRPDFGEAVSLRPGEVPVFWACGVTPQLALEQARLDIAITHSPGHMFVTDLRDEAFAMTRDGS